MSWNGGLQLRWRAAILLGSSLATSLALLIACSGPERSRDPVRLVDRFGEASIAGASGTTPVPYGPTEWRFDAGDEHGARALRDVEELSAEGGVLRGRTTSGGSLVAVARTSDIPDDEPLHSIEVRARISAGSDLTVRFGTGEEIVVPALLGNPFGAFTTPLRAGEMQTYTIRLARTRTADSIDHVVLTPSDAAGAEFEIESIRLVFRQEHLASIPAGVSWQGMGEIYRETIVTQSPEVVQFEVELPERPLFTYAAATTTTTTVQFSASVQSIDDPERRTERSHDVEEPDRWHEGLLDLEEWGGERVQITLAARSDEEGALAFWGAPTVRSRRPADDGSSGGVILLLTDTLRSDHLASWGYERDTAPTLTRIANEGVRFAEAISQGTWTKVSVPSIQSSLYPTTHTVADIPDRLPASATTIAEVYREAGYATLALTTISFVGRLTALQQGYEILHEGASIDDALGPKTADELVGRLVPWLEQHRDIPFFVLLHVADPHSPYRPLAEDETVYSEPGDMDTLDEMLETVRPHIQHHPLMRRFGMPIRSELVDAGIDPDEFVRHELNGYDGSIRGMDNAIAHLLDELTRLGLDDKTLLGVVSDHGTEFLDHDAHFHGHTLYGELNRIPMLVWQPGTVPAGRTVESTVQAIDLMPTLLELSGLPIPAAAQGASLVPLFDGTGEERWNRPAITEAPMNMRNEVMTAIQNDEWKLIRVGDPAEEALRFELYRFREDPLNRNDLSAEHPEVVAALAEQLGKWRAYAESARLDDTAITESLDAEELERLRSLGYIQ